MLQRLYVDNYRCLVNFDLPLQELSLLLGPIRATGDGQGQAPSTVGGRSACAPSSHAFASGV